LIGSGYFSIKTDSEKLVYMDLYRLREACLHGLIQTQRSLFTWTYTDSKRLVYMDLYRLREACLHGLIDSEKLVYMDL